MRYAIALFIALAVAAGCGPKNYENIDYTKFPDPRGKEILIGVGDVIEINVWEQKDLGSETTVRPDGTITMPLVGDIKAAGRTPTQLRDTIKTSLQNFLKLSAGNEITVKVKTYNSYRFAVNGEVSRPGVFTNPDYVTVAEAVALAGGPTRFAKRSDIVVIRKDPKGQQSSIPIDFDLVASGKRPDMNIWILAGDVIYVP